MNGQLAAPALSVALLFFWALVGYAPPGAPDIVLDVDDACLAAPPTASAPS